MLVHKYVDENSSAAMLATKRSAGVTPEVNLRILLCSGEEARKQEIYSALKLRADIIRSPKQGLQKTNVFQTFLKNSF